MKTNKQLGAVYLEVDGLDKERFKELTKGMIFYRDDVDYNLRYSFIENYIHQSGKKGTWIGLGYEDSIEPESKLITLDELEQLLKPKKDMKQFQEWSKKEDLLILSIIDKKDNNTKSSKIQLAIREMYRTNGKKLTYSQISNRYYKINKKSINRNEIINNPKAPIVKELAISEKINYLSKINDSILDISSKIKIFGLLLLLILASMSLIILTK